jgi:phosphonate transport system substrate-binding protein
MRGADIQGDPRWSRRGWLVTLMASTLSLGWMCGAAQAASPVVPTWTVAVVPQFQAVDIQRTWAPLLERLGRELGVKFELRLARDIPSFEADFKAGKPDLAYLNPYHAVMAHQAQAYVPVVRDVTPLAGLVVVRKDSRIRDVKDLQGQDLSFPAPNAFGASLWIRALLTERHRLKFQPVYGKTHTNAYRLVLAGKTAAAGGIRATLDREPDEVRQQLRVLFETPAVPPHPLVRHPRVPAALGKALAEAFDRMRADSAGQALLAGVLMPRPVPAIYARDYQPLEQLRLETYVE